MFGDFNYQYDIASFLVILTLLLINFFYKRFPTWKNQLFHRQLLCCGLVCILNLAELFFSVNQINAVVFEIVTVVHYLGIVLMVLIFYLFIFSLNHKKVDVKNIGKSLLAAITIFEILIVLTNPVTHWVAYVDEKGRHLGYGFTFICEVGAVLVIMAFIQMLRVKGASSREKKMTVIIYTVSITLSLVAQYIKPELNLMGLAVTITLICCMITLQSPIELIHAKTGCYNYLAFQEAVYLKDASHKNFSIFFVYIKNSSTIKNQFGIDEHYRLTREVGQNIRTGTTTKVLFNVFSSCYCTICSDEQQMNYLLEKSRDVLYKPLHLKEGDTETEIDPPFQFLPILIHNVPEIEKRLNNNPGDTPENILNLVHYVINNMDMEVARYCEIDDALVTKYLADLVVLNRMKAAIKSQAFEVYLQPIYNLRTKTFTGAESLLRLKGDNGEFIPTLDFIRIAEKSGDILKIGEISLRKTCQFIKAAHLEDTTIEQVNVNLSMVQCMQTNLVDQLVRIIEEEGVNIRLICFELTETENVKDEVLFQRTITRMADMGFKFALDDYGTGYSNMSKVINYPLSEIKIDKSLVDMTENSNSKNNLLLKNLTSMFRENEFEVLAEGVETKEVSQMMEKMGCNLIQGFYYARPMPLEVFKNFKEIYKN
ncbi:MAG: EAL domain-containing protein [Treponema sp.]|nr:EAL domain-containing protein [Treponema sp.]